MAIDIAAPQSSTGIMMILGVIALVIVVIFATSIGTILLGAVVIAVALYLLIIAGGRVNDWLRHGKPLMRRRARQKERKQTQQASGGDEQ